MVRSTERTLVLLAVVMSVLALADGALHLVLDFVLFQGNLIGRLGPPPGVTPPPGGGGGSPLLLPLNLLFVFNLLGYVTLVLLLWFVAPRLGSRSWVIDVLFLIYVALVCAGWLRMGAPNPRGYLGYLSKTMELLLVLTVLARIWFRQSTSRLATPQHTT